MTKKDEKPFDKKQKTKGRGDGVGFQTAMGIFKRG